MGSHSNQALKCQPVPLTSCLHAFFDACMMYRRSSTFALFLVDVLQQTNPHKRSSIAFLRAGAACAMRMRGLWTFFASWPQAVSCEAAHMFREAVDKMWKEAAAKRTRLCGLRSVRLISNTSHGLRQTGNKNKWEVPIQQKTAFHC